MVYGDYELYDSHYLFTYERDILDRVSSSTENGSKVPRPEESEDERVVLTPDEMWGYSTDEVLVNWREGVTQTIILYPHLYTCNYTYEIRNVTNLQYVTRICAAISGMSGEFDISTEVNSLETMTLPLDAEWTSTTIYGQFYTFGYNEDIDVTKQLMLYVWSADGAKHSYGTSGDEHFNVTQQILDAPDKRNVHIIIDGLELYRPQEVNSDGFSTSTDDWEEENTTIYL